MPLNDPAVRFSMPVRRAAAVRWAGCTRAVCHLTFAGCIFAAADKSPARTNGARRVRDTLWGDVAAVKLSVSRGGDTGAGRERGGYLSNSGTRRSGTVRGSLPACPAAVGSSRAPVAYRPTCRRPTPTRTRGGANSPSWSWNEEPSTSAL